MLFNALLLTIGYMTSAAGKASTRSQTTFEYAKPLAFHGGFYRRAAARRCPPCRLPLASLHLGPFRQYGLDSDSLLIRFVPREQSTKILKITKK